MFNPKHLTTVAALALTSAIAPAGHATEDVSVHELVAQSLQEFPGKEVLMIEVTFAPGAADPVHRHDAHGFIYVLEGSIVMQVAGGEEVTLTSGQTFYEGPSDLHIVGRNASKTVPAKFLAILVKNEGAPVLTVE
jgi:quercetin dioxygenase-like cupin family protein